MGGPFRRIIIIGHHIPEKTLTELTRCAHGLAPPLPYFSLADATARFKGKCDLVILGEPVGSKALAVFLKEHEDPPVIGLVGEHTGHKQVMRYCEVADLCRVVREVLGLDTEAPI